MERIKRKINKNTGITIIALVVTLIIMTILIGTTVTSVFWDRGLFSRAKQLKSESEKQYEIEMIKKRLTEKYASLDGKTITYDDIIDERKLWKK